MRLHGAEAEGQSSQARFAISRRTLRKCPQRGARRFVPTMGAAWCDPYQSVGDEQFNVSPTHSCLCTQRSLVTPPRSRDELCLRERKLSQQGQRTPEGWWPAFERVWCDEEGTARQKSQARMARLSKLSFPVENGKARVWGELRSKKARQKCDRRRNRPGRKAASRLCHCGEGVWRLGSVQGESWRLQKLRPERGAAA